MSSITDKLLKSKKEKEAADKKAAAEASNIQENSQKVQTLENEENPGEENPPETQLATTVDVDKAQEATQTVAEQAGVEETPVIKTNAGSPLLGGVQSGIGHTANVNAAEVGVFNPILEVDKSKQTPEQRMTGRTEVDTHLTLVEAQPEGHVPPEGYPILQDPPLGTLPNSMLVYNGDPNNIMTQADMSMAAGKAMDAVSDEDNKKALAFYEGEQKRQRMLDGRPTAQDLLPEVADDADAPVGSYKNVSLNQFYDSKGDRVTPVNGYFVPKNQEQEDMLEHYAKAYVVERPKQTAKE